ncbi:MAG: MBL fold metallo-hydrolase [Anaerolineales bacterium]|jgi:L-ascorbate metabolism protein UlaG (beta-lactamase superfamily)
MEITWYGLSCFRLTERGMASVVTDPYDHEVSGFEPLKLRGEIVTVSHDAPGHNFVSAVKGRNRVITGPGEFEIGGVFITGVQTNLKSKVSQKELRNTLYVMDYDGITVAHLGDIQKVPSQTEVENLGGVNVVLVPVGGGGSLNAAKAAEIVSLLEPGIVIPMYYQLPESKIKLSPLSRFLQEMGVGKIEPIPSLKITRTSVPSEARVVVLEYKH